MESNQEEVIHKQVPWLRSLNREQLLLLKLYTDQVIGEKDFDEGKKEVEPAIDPPDSEDDSELPDYWPLDADFYPFFNVSPQWLLKEEKSKPFIILKDSFISETRLEIVTKAKVIRQSHFDAEKAGLMYENDQATLILVSKTGREKKHFQGVLSIHLTTFMDPAFADYRAGWYNGALHAIPPIGLTPQVLKFRPLDGVEASTPYGEEDW